MLRAQGVGFRLHWKDVVEGWQDAPVGEREGERVVPHESRCGWDERVDLVWGLGFRP